MAQWRQAETGTQRFARVETCVPARVATVDPERDPDTGKLFFRSTESTTANLSRGGAFVESWEPLAPGTRVILTLTLPWDAEIQVVAQVAWTRRKIGQREESNALESPGYGLEFVGGSSVELAALDLFLTQARDDTTAPAEATAQSATPTP